jgi:putative salt-induced outer membrane protein YdiY
MVLTLAVDLGLARGDEVKMHNGDRISGTILGMEAEVLTIKTSYAGELTIQQEAIAAITTDSSIEVVLSDDTATKGIIFTSEEGRLGIKTEEGAEALTFGLEAVEAINAGPPVRLTCRVNVGADVAKGNTETENYHLDGELLARTKKQRYSLWAEYDQAYESDVKSEDKSFWRGSYDYFIAKQWFLWLDASFEADEFKDLTLRSAGGVGPGYQFFETPLKDLSAEVGFGYINEEYDADGQQDYTISRCAVNYGQWFLHEKIQLFHRDEAFLSLEDTDDYIIRTRTGLRLRLVKGINATFQYNWQYDSAVPPGEKQTDQRYLVTVGYEYTN